MRWGDVIRGCYRRKIHTEDNGATRRRNQKRLAKLAKLKAIANGELDGISEINDDASTDGKVKKPARKGRPPKAEATQREAGGAGTAKKTPKGRSRKDVATEDVKPPAKGVNASAESVSATRIKKTPLLYEDLDDSQGESEVSERFDFNTDEEDGNADLDLEASDVEKEAAYFAAAEGSREMQFNDLEGSSPSSPSSPSSTNVCSSPSKKRRTLDSDAPHGEEHPEKQSSVSNSNNIIAPSSANMNASSYRQVLEISDSE